MKLGKLVTILLLLLATSLSLRAAPVSAAEASAARTSTTEAGPRVLVSVLSGTCPGSIPGQIHGLRQTICLAIAFTPTGIPAGESRTITVQLWGHIVGTAPGTVQVFNSAFRTFTVDSSANGALQRPPAGCSDIFGASGILTHHEFRVVPGPGIALTPGSIVTSASFECVGEPNSGIPPTNAVILADTGGIDFRYLAAGLGLVAIGLVLFLLGRRRRPSTGTH